MSRRRIEAGFNTTSSSFSLIDCVSESNTSSSVVQNMSRSEIPQIAKTSPTTLLANKGSKPAGLPVSFSLEKLTGQDRSPASGIKNNTTPDLSALTFKLSNLSTVKPVSSNNSTDKTTKPLAKNAFGMPMKPNTMSHLNPELMRLTAQSDDLRTRLKTASERAMFLESQVQRMQKSMMKERSDFAKQLTGARNEIVALKQMEGTLKTQIAQLNASMEKKSSFESAVKSAMQNKEHVDAQAKLDEIQAQHATIASQIELLEERRNAAVAEMQSCTSKTAQMDEKLLVTTNSLKETDQKVEELKALLAAKEEEANNMEIKLESLNAQSNEVTTSIESKQEELSQVQSKISALEDTAAGLERSLECIREETHKTAREHSCYKIQSAFKQKQLTSLKTLMSTLEEKRETQQALSVTMKGLRVFGDGPPDQALIGCPTDNILKRTDDMSSLAHGMPYHFALDAPISLTGNSTQMIESNHGEAETDGNTESLLAALVGDLKEFLAQASVENEKRGLNTGMETGLNGDTETLPLAVCVS